MLTRSIGIAVLAVLGLASAAAADPPAPFAQSSLQPNSLDCTPPSIPPFADTGLFLRRSRPRPMPCSLA